MLKLAIVENEPEQAELLKNYIFKYSEEYGQKCSVKVYGNGVDFLTDYQYDIDAVFMDIIMPLENGFKIAEKLRGIDQNVLIIFVTSTMKFAIEGYQVNALSYLVKPVSYFDFCLNLNKIIKIKNAKNTGFLFINSEGGINKIYYNDILYIETVKHNVFVHTTAESYVYRGSLKEIEQKLSANGFVRCHNSYIVNLRHLWKINGDKVILDTDEKEVFISRNRRKKLLEEVKRYIING